MTHRDRHHSPVTRLLGANHLRISQLTPAALSASSASPRYEDTNTAISRLTLSHPLHPLLLKPPSLPLTLRMIQLGCHCSIHLFSRPAVYPLTDPAPEGCRVIHSKSNPLSVLGRTLTSVSGGLPRTGTPIVEKLWNGPPFGNRLRHSVT